VDTDYWLVGHWQVNDVTAKCFEYSDGTFSVTIESPRFIDEDEMDGWNSLIQTFLNNNNRK
jgi:hypothetical protein